MATYAPSAARLAANIANSQHSTGPTSEAGRAASSRNAFKHGLAAANLYVPENLQPLYKEITTDLNEAIHPEGTLEDEAFSQLRDARFQMERILILQAEVARQSVARGLDPLNDPTIQKQWDRLERYRRVALSDFRANMKETQETAIPKSRNQATVPQGTPASQRRRLPPHFDIGRERMKLGRIEANYIFASFRNPVPPSKPAGIMQHSA